MSQPLADSRTEGATRSPRVRRIKGSPSQTPTTERPAPSITVDAGALLTKGKAAEGGDKVLAHLRNMLEYQSRLKLPASRDPEDDPLAPPVSGAILFRLRRQPGERRRESDPPKTAKLRAEFARAERLRELANALGADTSAVKRDLGHARRALYTGRIGKAAYGVRKSSSLLRDAVGSEFDTRCSALTDSIKKTAGSGADMAKVDNVLRTSKRRMRMGRIEDAVSGLLKSEGMTRECQTELVARIMDGSKSKFLSARKAGLDIVPAVRLMNESRRALKAGDIERAVASAKTSSQLIGRELATHEKAKSALRLCSRAVAAVQSLGVDSDEARKKLDEVRKRFRSNQLDACVRDARSLVADMKECARQSAAHTMALAQRSSELARDAGVSADDSDDLLSMAQEALEKDEYARSIEYSNMSMLKSNSMLSEALDSRVRQMDRFAKGVTGGLSGVDEIEQAISSSKERSLETVRKYSQMAEQIVGQAYDSAASYTRVTQDLVRQACQDFVGSNGQAGQTEIEDAPVGSGVSLTQPVAESVKIENQRLRIVDLYLAGKITSSEMDRLLSMIEQGAKKGLLADAAQR